MKKLLFLIITISIYCSSAGMSIADKVHKRQITGPFCATEKEKVIQQYKQQMLNSSGLEPSAIPITLSEALLAKKIFLLTPLSAPGKPYLMPYPQCPSTHLQLKQINMVDGLKDAPITVGLFSQSGASFTTFDPTNAQDHHERIEIEQIKCTIDTIDLSNTSIQKIKALELSAFPSLTTIHLPASTPEHVKKYNHKENPTVRFYYIVKSL